MYGRDPALRSFCEDRGVGYVLGVPCTFAITVTSCRKVRADQALNLVPAKAWTRASCGRGSKGERLNAWAWVATARPRHHLLVRRNLNDPTDQAFFSCYVPDARPITLGILVKIAGMRWPVEEDFLISKDQFGLDQVRLYHAILRHLALAMTALAVCATTAATMRPTTSTPPPPPTSPDQQPPRDLGLIPLTVTETRRLLNLLTRSRNPPAHHLRWNWWRRRHQARARWYHPPRTATTRNSVKVTKCGCRTSSPRSHATARPVCRGDSGAPQAQPAVEPRPRPITAGQTKIGPRPASLPGQGPFRLVVAGDGFEPT